MLGKLNSGMVYIGRWMTPRGPFDVAFKLAVMTVLITFFSIAAERILMGQIAYTFWPRFLLTAVSAFPFLIIIVVSFRVAHNSRLKLRQLADTDTLTNLPNRRAFMTAIDATMAARTIGYLMILDGDAFKSVNDSLGHAMGDCALLAIAARLDRLRGPDLMAARLGGDEFGVLAVGSDPLTQIMGIERDLCAGVPFTWSDKQQELTIYLSAGAAQLAPDTNVLRIMGDADRALYTAKKSGGARLIVSDQKAPLPMSA